MAAKLLKKLSSVQKRTPPARPHEAARVIPRPPLRRAPAAPFRRTFRRQRRRSERRTRRAHRRGGIVGELLLDRLALRRRKEARPVEARGVDAALEHVRIVALRGVRITRITAHYGDSAPKAKGAAPSPRGAAWHASRGGECATGVFRSRGRSLAPLGERGSSAVGDRALKRAARRDRLQDRARRVGAGRAAVGERHEPVEPRERVELRRARRPLPDDAASSAPSAAGVHSLCSFSGIARSPRMRLGKRIEGTLMRYLSCSSTSETL